MNKDLFKTYKDTEDGHEVMMGDNHTSKVIGSGNMEIQFISGRKLFFMNVLHVPNIKKNLVSGFKLCLIHQRTTPYTPQQNGVAERKHRVLQDMINAMLVSANLPKNFVGIKRLHDDLEVTAAKYKSYNCSKIKTAERVSTVKIEWIKTEERIKIDWRSRLPT
ncbi:zinc finger, CCHC-type containing protein [Tanacetum coccineum]